jgi:predicted nucleotidyltransferase
MVNASDWRGKRYLKDDYVRDAEGIIYLVILNDHPHESVVVIPKYVPKPGGKWRGSYERLFHNYTSNEFHKAAGAAIFQKYQFYSQNFDKKLLALPHNAIVEHYVPEIKLKEMMSSSRKILSFLERKAVDLANILSEMDVDLLSVGITGSLLYDLHMPFSNLNVILYGFDAIARYLNKVDEVVAKYSFLSFKHQSLDLNDKQLDLSSRIKTFLWMDGVSTAIHTNEFPDFHFVYGSEFARNLGKCEIIGTIHNVLDGFARKNYIFSPIDVITWPSISKDLPKNLRLRIFSGRSEDIIFRENEIVRACGMLQWIESAEQRHMKDFYQLSVGFEEFPGYVYPISLLNCES